MNTLPANILRCMSKADRQPLGKAGMTPDEATQASQGVVERELQQEISSYLNMRSVPYFWQRMDRKATGRKGTPDFIWCYRRQFCAAEAKAVWGRLTPEQEAMLARIRSNGGVAIVAHRLEDVKRVMDDIDANYGKEAIPQG